MRKIISIFTIVAIVFMGNAFDLASSAVTETQISNNTIDNTYTEPLRELGELELAALSIKEKITIGQEEDLIAELTPKEEYNSFIFDKEELDKLAELIEEKKAAEEAAKAEEELEFNLEKSEDNKESAAESTGNKSTNSTTNSNSTATKESKSSNAKSSSSSSGSSKSSSSSESSSSTSSNSSNNTSNSTPEVTPEPEPEAPAVGSGPFDTGSLNNGVLVVRYQSNNDKRIRLMVEKGGQQYTYNITSSNVRIPLQMGNGTYNLTLLENTEGTSYKVLLRDTVRLNLSNQNRVYLQSVQNISWNNNLNAVKKAKQLTNGVSSNQEKVKRIYEYVINNVEYDFAKANNVTPLYLPNISSTYSSNKGICYDYSAMLAAMLRSVNIPTKLVMGYAPNVSGYHAWNEVYLDGKWVVIDSTVDAQYVAANQTPTMIKNKSQFNVERVY